MRGISSPAYVKVDDWTGTKVFARIKATPVDGIIHIEDTEFWDSERGRWVSSPPSLPVGSDIGFRVPVENTGGKAYFKLTTHVWGPKTQGVWQQLTHMLEPGATRDFEFGTDFYMIYNFPHGNYAGDYYFVDLLLEADPY